jgi:hypothetical protein
MQKTCSQILPAQLRLSYSQRLWRMLASLPGVQMRCMQRYRSHPSTCSRTCSKLNFNHKRSTKVEQSCIHGAVRIPKVWECAVAAHLSYLPSARGRHMRPHCTEKSFVSSVLKRCERAQDKYGGSICHFPWRTTNRIHRSNKPPVSPPPVCTKNSTRANIVTMHGIKSVME